MYPHQIEVLTRSRLADTKRAAEPSVRRRSSLRILLEARQARAHSPAG